MVSSGYNTFKESLMGNKNDFWHNFQTFKAKNINLHDDWKTTHKINGNKWDESAFLEVRVSLTIQQYRY